jgi:murein L,D-transpeptidase YafK
VAVPASATVAVTATVAATAAASGTAQIASSPPRLRNATGWIASSDTPPNERVRIAKETRTSTVQKLFADAGVAFPPAELLFRTFKHEKELEVWAAAEKGGVMTRVATYEVCRMSGDLGPKRGEGDMQVPEGFYTIQYYWPISDYHLEMKVGYPNASDKVLGQKMPGGDIMIHGSCASIGCIAMGDERIEELWVMATSFHSTERRVNVHIYPSRDMPKLLQDSQHKRHWAFWTNLKEGLDHFEQSRRLPAVSVDWRGRYTFR